MVVPRELVFRFDCPLLALRVALGTHTKHSSCQPRADFVLFLRRYFGSFGTDKPGAASEDMAKADTGLRCRANMPSLAATIGHR